MNTSLRNELLNHVIDTIKDQDITDLDELHYHAFNEDYYIIGYYQAEQWLKHHEINPFEAIADVIEYQQTNFGIDAIDKDDINAEKIVNLYVYALGEELLSDYDLDQDVSGLLKDLKGDLDE